MSVAGGPDAVVVRDSATTHSTTDAPRTMSFPGLHVAVPVARPLSLALLVLSLLTATALAALARRTSPSNEAEQTRRRWPSWQRGRPADPALDAKRRGDVRGP